MADDFLGGFDWINSLGGGSSAPTPSFNFGGSGTGLDTSGLFGGLGGGLSGFNSTLGNVAGAVGGGSGGGGMGLNDILRGLAPALSLATTGAGIGSSIYGMTQAAGQRATLEKEQKRQASLAAPAAAAGSQLTAAGSQAMLGGALPQQLESQVDQFKANARMKIRDYLAKAGISDSTMAQQFDTFIDMQADSLRSQLAQNLLQSGYSGIGAAMGPSGQVSASAQGLMGGTTDAINAANKSIALLLGATQNG